MKTSQKVLDHVAEYEADRNCPADLWFNDLVRTNDLTKEEAAECMNIVLTNTYQRVYSTNMTEEQREARLKELTTWDKPRFTNDIEHTAKVRALKNLSCS
jgi:hypothetical protein